MVFMVLGMLNFSLQYEVWRGKLGELWRNLETRSLALTLLFTLGLVLAGITLAGTFSGFASDLRRGAYQLVSGHSGTGFMTVYGTQMGARWGDQTLSSPSSSPWAWEGVPVPPPGRLRPSG
ncbi:MAG: hypothetical protein ACUVT4_03455 [Actinomycetota bacterium]